MPAHITGLVLAGGSGSRMGGADKGLLDWHGVPLAVHAARRLASQVDTVAISANRNAAVYASHGYAVWPDAAAERPGPLAGMLAALERCGTDLLATVACDTPLFPTDLIQRLARALAESGADLAMAATRESGAIQPQPVFVLMHASMRDSLAGALAAGIRGVRRWSQGERCVDVVFEDVAAFANANTPAELDALRA